MLFRLSPPRRKGLWALACAFGLIHTVYAAGLKDSSTGAKVSVTATSSGLTDSGKVTTKIGIGGSYARGVAIQADGKIVVAGVGLTAYIENDFAVARYSANGSLDTSFGGTGFVTTNISGRIASTDWVRGVAIQNDGKIVVVGYTQKSGDAAMGRVLLRYNSDGNLDASFAGSGMVLSLDSAKNTTGHAVALQPDGKIVIAGAVNCTDRLTAGYCTLLERYNSDGSLDSSFNGPGIGRVDGNTQGAQGLVLQSDGKILVVGTKDSGNGYELSVVRYRTDGQIDSSFGNGGVSTVAIGLNVGSSNYGSSVALQADGSIFVAGVAHSNSANNHFSLTKLMTNGAVDASFGSLGSVVTNVATPPDSDYSYAIAVQPDGKILVAGEANTDFAVVRYNSNGSLDTSFGTNGKTTTDFGLLTDVGYAIALQSDGSILVSGSSQTFMNPGTYISFATARYTTDGNLDPTFRNGTGAPVCTLSANPTIIFANGTSVLISNCTNSPTSYTWTGGTCTGTTAATCTVTPTATTTYTVAGVNAGGTGTAASATVTVTSGTTSTLITRYRLYHDGTKEHLYTTDANEYSVLATRGWLAEGAIYQLYQGAGSLNGVVAVPFYRLYNRVSLQHHWTTDANEYNVLGQGDWTKEGVDGYILPSSAAGSIPVYRLYLNAFGGLHLWTTDLNEKNVLSTRGWVYEGVSGYVVPLQ